MGDEHALALRLDNLARQMVNDNVPPYEERTVSLSQGELTMLVKALILMSAVREATKPL